MLDEAFGIQRAFLTTVHAYTNEQRLADVPAEDPRRGRAAAENIIPQESNVAEVITELFPHLEGRLTGEAMNVPVANGSVVDLVCWHDKPVTVDGDQRGGAHRGLALARASSHYEDDPIVSSDIIRSSYSEHLRLPGHHGARRAGLEDPLLVRQRLGLRPPGGRPDPPSWRSSTTRRTAHELANRHQRFRPHRAQRLPHPQRAGRRRGRGDQRPLRQRAAGLPAALRHGHGRLPEDGARRRRGALRRRRARPDDRRARPGELCPGASWASTSSSSPPASSATARKLEQHLDGRRRQGRAHRAAQGRDRRHGRAGRQRRRASSPSTGSSPTPPAPPTAWRRWPRSSTTLRHRGGAA